MVIDCLMMNFFDVNYYNVDFWYIVLCLEKAFDEDGKLK